MHKVEVSASPAGIDGPSMHAEVPCATVRNADQCCLHFFAHIGKPSLTESARIDGKLLDTYEVVYSKWSPRRAGRLKPWCFVLDLNQGQSEQQMGRHSRDSKWGVLDENACIIRLNRSGGCRD